MATTVIKNARIVNEGQIIEGDLLIENGLFSRIGGIIESPPGSKEVRADGLLAMPGIIDDQVHFREPGLTHKGDIGSEARAAVAGGVTSFMEMPNVKPPTLNQSLLEEKYQIAARHSLANYSFYMGVSNDNLDEVLRTDPARVCGLKIFMGSSTGNMLVDDQQTLENVFRETPMLIAVHCEDEATIRTNAADARARYGEDVPMYEHPRIRSVEACYLSSSRAVALAQKYNTRLHVLHISTRDELALFDPHTPLRQKRITAEVCVHHLFFNDADYATLGARIKWNPAVKGAEHQSALLQGLLDNRLDIIATDHAPHTWAEKQQPYFDCPSGGPLVQHALPMMLRFYHEGAISLERIVEKMCHAPAECFRLRERGYLREGYHADLILVDPLASWEVSAANLYYKCGWSPLEGSSLRGKVITTFVNGEKVWDGGQFFEHSRGQRLLFDAQ